MKFTQFIIKNFKGIESIVFDLEKSPDANVYTLVGLNESGKTTILEAINMFSPNNSGISALEIPGTKINDYNSIIPISNRDNFNGTISLEVTLKLEQRDIDLINEAVEKETIFKRIKPVSEIKYFRKWNYKNSEFQGADFRWSGFSGWLKSSLFREMCIKIDDKKYANENIFLSNFCNTLIPSIWYFPNFLFDFPAKIILKPKEEPNAKEKFYLDLIQDILCSLENDTNIETHLVERIKSSDKAQKKNLDRLIQRMERKVTEVVFEAWGRIFKRTIKETSVVINYGADAKNIPYLEFEIESEDGIYQINERSLGFRWFFVFLLFTQFRSFRKNTPKNMIFLFDEPASNLHSSAQKQLLDSFSNLTKDSKIIYTTHSHHLINPNWLESTYVVKNEGLDLGDHESYNVNKTNITIQPYREFVSLHPHNTAYFQPILDVLEYSPSNLENIPNCVFLEGKNDYYVLTYFKTIIFENKYELNFAPSTGSGNLDTLISLYLGWGRNFIVLLDSDKAGKKEKERYIDKFGIVVENKIFTLEDIKPSWSKTAFERFFENNEALEFQKKCYPDSMVYDKKQFNRSIQECLINSNFFDFSEETLKNFKETLMFLHNKLNEKLF